MLKKYISIFFLVVCYTIILGHNIIPHHHHDKDDIFQHHHHGEEDESNNLNHLFSHFQHQTDEIVFTHLQKNDYSLFKVDLPIAEAFTFSFNLNGLIILPILYERPPIYHAYSSPDLLPSGLRAPPIV
jgi:hypothetical protein